MNTVDTTEHIGAKFCPLYIRKQIPVFQNKVYAAQDEAIGCSKGDLYLVENLDTGLVYNAAFNPALVVYDSDYQNEQAVSHYFQTHLNEIVEIVAAHLPQDSLVEVGCGKGYFLEKLRDRGANITGFDPTYEGNASYIQKKYFNPEAGMTAKGLILRHVLEHIQDPYAFLCQLRDTNHGQGLAYIEVPCFDWICNHKAWFDVFYEHVNYFRKSDFSRMFGRVLASGHVFNSQYMYVVADLASLRPPIRDPNDPVNFPIDFDSGLQTSIAAYPNGRVVWGGASKGVTFSLMRSRCGHPITTVIDINPAKQGKYLPATGLKVFAPDDVLPNLPEKSTIFVMNSNYLMEIRAMSQNLYTYVEVEHE